MTIHPIQPIPVPGTKGPAWKAKGASLILLIAGVTAVLLPEEGRTLNVILDSAGIPTVCMGLTGAVTKRHPGIPWTVDECKQAEAEYIAPMVTALSACIPANVRDDMAYGEMVIYGSLSFNGGINAVCKSSIARHLKEGDHEGACRSMAAWTWTRVKAGTTPAGRTNGKPQPALRQDCRDPRNRCNGLPRRRDRDVAACLEAL